MVFFVFIMKAIRSMFGEYIGKYKPYLGGIHCSDQLDGGSCSGEKTKGAYPDVAMVWGDRLLLIEIDENRHHSYNEQCELARYDTLMHGQKDPRSTKVIRLNPHNCEGMELPLIERIRVLLQYIRNELKSMEDKQQVDLHVMEVAFLFYATACSSFLTESLEQQT
jgi:hypothetical protein